MNHRTVELVGGPLDGTVHELAADFPPPDVLGLPHNNGMAWYAVDDATRTKTPVANFAAWLHKDSTLNLRDILHTNRNPRRTAEPETNAMTHDRLQQEIERTRRELKRATTAFWILSALEALCAGAFVYLVLNAARNTAHTP